MTESTSSQMRWHKEELVDDGKMRHPADSKAWKHVDNKYGWFAKEAHNIRLGLASDGFNPFGMQKCYIHHMACYPHPLQFASLVV